MGATNMSKKFRKGTKVLILLDRADGGFDTVEAVYERPFGSCYHQARKSDGGIVQCHSDKITKAAL